MIFQSILIDKLVNALKCMIRAVELIIKWLVCSVFSVNIARLNFFVCEVLATLDSRRILLSRMQHNIATA